MNSYKSKLRFFLSHNLNQLYLMLASFVGLLTGISLSFKSAYAFAGIDCNAFFTKPSVIYLLFINLLPIILIYIFIISSLHQLCFPLIFLDGVCSGCCRMGLFYLFGNSSWLMQFFLMLSHFVATVFWWLLLFCNAKENSCDLRKRFYLYFVIISVITILDVYLVAPVLSEINTTL